jgi:uncharacterized protein YkwD
MKKPWLSNCLLLIAFLHLLLFSSCKDESPIPEPLPPLPAIENVVLEAVNEHRQSLGLDALQSDTVVRAEARQHSSDMGLKRLPLGHDGFHDRVVRISKILGEGAAGENVAKSNDDGKYTVDSLWLLSPGHKGNIEGGCTLTGIGVVEGKDGYFYYTQIFLNKLSR